MNQGGPGTGAVLIVAVSINTEKATMLALSAKKHVHRYFQKDKCVMPLEATGRNARKAEFPSHRMRHAATDILSAMRTSAQEFPERVGSGPPQPVAIATHPAEILPHDALQP